MLRASMAGGLAGAAAAGLWAFIVISSGALFSSFAPLIGVAVGLATRFAWKREKAPTGSRQILGLIASLITLAWVLLGKLAFLAGLTIKNFGATPTWQSLSSPFFTSLMGLRGIYLLAALTAAYAIVATASDRKS